MLMSHLNLKEKAVRIKNIVQKIGHVNDQYQIHEVENVADQPQGITEEDKEAGQTRGIDLRVPTSMITVMRIEDEDMIQAVRTTQKMQGPVITKEVEVGIDEVEAEIDGVEAEKGEIVIDEAVQGQVPTIETGTAMAIPRETTEDDANIQLYYSSCIVY